MLVLSDLPNDLIARVLNSAVLDFKELLTATQTCQCWRQRLAELHTLKLTSAAQCHAGALRLCSAATKVIALVVDEVPDSTSGRDVRVKLEMAGQLTFALTALPQLERLLLKSGWHTQVGTFGDTQYGDHDVGRTAVFGLMKAVCDARSAGLLGGLKHVAHGAHICPCSDFWTGENESMTAWTEELREEYLCHDCKGRCICRQLVESMPTETVFGYLNSHGLCLSAHTILKVLSERGFDLAGPCSSIPQLIEDATAGPGYPALPIDFPGNVAGVAELQRRWGRPLARCEVFALEFAWDGRYGGHPTRVHEDDEDVFYTEEEEERHAEYVLHVLVDLVGAAGRELLLRPELTDAIDEFQQGESGEAFRVMLREEMEYRVNASGDADGEDGSEHEAG